MDGLGEVNLEPGIRIQRLFLGRKGSNCSSGQERAVPWGSDGWIQLLRGEPRPQNAPKSLGAVNCPGSRCLAANTPDPASRQADNSISCWKGFLCARSSSGVSWAVRKPRPQPAAASSWAARGYFHIFSFPYTGVFSHGIYHPSFPRGIGFVLPNPTSDTTTPCERLRDVTGAGTGWLVQKRMEPRNP